jgi:acyl-coenzyme A synthetase/AMP-(fatty) acid ligase
MQPLENRSLRQRLGDATADRFLRGVHGGVRLADLAGGTGLGGRLAELAGRSVLLAAHDQLAAAVALIELDGVARRLVLCPPDLPAQHLAAIIADAEIDAIVSDRDATEHAAFGIPLHVAVGTALDPGDHRVRGGRRTEWLLLTSGTTGAPKLVSHNIASLTAPIKPAGEPPIWGTFYDIRRYGGLQIFLRAVIGGGSLILSSAGEPVGDHLQRLAAGGVTHLSGTPSHWRRALMSPATRAIAPRHIRLSGEIADQAILDRLRSVYPRASIGHAYASTEAGVGFEVNDGLEGFPASLVRVGEGEVDIKIKGGSLRLRSARTASFYVGRDAAALFDKDGFVDTGDMVELGGERYRFVGRKGGIINVGGHKVHPEEVEAAINRHPNVWASLVRPRRNPITGAIVTADVVLKDTPARGETDRRTAELEREIIAMCRHLLAPYKVPAVVRFVSTLDLTAIGKLVRRVGP